MENRQWVGFKFRGWPDCGGEMVGDEDNLLKISFAIKRKWYIIKKEFVEDNT